MPSAKVFLAVGILTTIFLVNVLEKCRVEPQAGVLSTALKGVKGGPKICETFHACISAVSFRQIFTFDTDIENIFTVSFCEP